MNNTSPRKAAIEDLIAFVCLMLLLACCNRKPEKTVSDQEHLVIKVNPPLKIDTEKGLGKYSDRLSGFKIIPLETTANNLTSQSYSVRIIGENIYICDKSYNKCIDVYSINGDFIVRVQSVGRGPHEYMRIYDYDIDEKTGDVIILDGTSKGLLVFDGTTGRYKKTIPLPPPGRFESFIKTGSKYIFHTGSIPSNDSKPAMLYVSDDKGVLLEKYLYYQEELVTPYPKGTDVGGINGRFVRTKDGIRVFWGWGVTVFRYNDETVDAFLTIDDSDYQPTQQMISAFQSMPPITHPIRGIVQYSEGNTHIHLSYSLTYGPHAQVFYNKLTGNQEVYIGSIDDITYCGGPIWGIFKDKLVKSYTPGFGVEGNKIIENLRSGVIPMDDKQAETLINRMIHNTEQGGGSSNPIIILYDFKVK